MSTLSRPGDFSTRIAAEALRKARATLECAGWGRLDCHITQTDPSYIWAEMHDDGMAQLHVYVASVLLDGFSVDELTAVGG